LGCAKCDFVKAFLLQDKLITKNIGKYGDKPDYLSCIKPKEGYYFYEEVSKYYEGTLKQSKVIKKKNTLICQANC
jgi:hypothetical protein